MKSAKYVRKSIQLIVISATLTLSGCMIGPSYEEPTVDMPTHWTMSELPPGITGAPNEQVAWWDSFQDPLLSELVAEALRENLDLEAAGLRVLQYRATKVRAAWGLAPIPQAKASYGRSYYSKNVKPEVEVSGGQVNFQKGQFAIVGDPAIQLVSPPSLSVTRPKVSLADHIDVYGVGLSALWEPDLWGKTRRRIKSAAAQQDASIAEYDNIAVVIASEVASTYIQIRTVDARIEQLERNVELLGDLSNHSGSGDLGSGNVALAGSLSGDAKARLIDLKTARTHYENALCVLLGVMPGSLDERLGSGPIPVPPPEIAIGIPTDLLRRRPDVRAAERLAAAQSEKVGITKARLYPSFTLLGSIGLSASNSGDLFDSDSEKKAYGAGVSWDILLYPFIQERVRIEEAKYQESLINFQNVVIKAAAEAENALASYANALEKTDVLAQSARSADEATDFRMDAVREEDSAFDSAFTAMEYRLSQNDKYIEGMGTQAIAMVRLYAALGGGWEVQAGTPFVKEEVKEAMRDRTDWWSFGGRKRLDQTR